MIVTTYTHAYIYIKNINTTKLIQTLIATS